MKVQLENGNKSMYYETYLYKEIPSKIGKKNPFKDCKMEIVKQWIKKVIFDTACQVAVNKNRRFREFKIGD